MLVPDLKAATRCDEGSCRAGPADVHISLPNCF